MCRVQAATRSMGRIVFAVFAGVFVWGADAAYAKCPVNSMRTTMPPPGVSNFWHNMQPSIELLIEKPAPRHKHRR
jgi:hypothetical protein